MYGIEKSELIFQEWGQVEIVFFFFFFFSLSWYPLLDPRRTLDTSECYSVSGYLEQGRTTFKSPGSPQAGEATSFATVLQ